MTPFAGEAAGIVAIAGRIDTGTPPLHDQRRDRGDVCILGQTRERGLPPPRRHFSIVVEELDGMVVHASPRDAALPPLSRRGTIPEAARRTMRAGAAGDG